MEERYCQSCAMPMGQTDELCGTNADGSKNADYCTYCYQGGKFTATCTMKEMIDFCAPMTGKAMGITEQQAKEQMRAFFPKLKRWAK